MLHIETRDPVTLSEYGLLRVDFEELCRQWEFAFNHETRGYLWAGIVCGLRAAGYEVGEPGVRYAVAEEVSRG